RRCRTSPAMFTVSAPAPEGERPRVMWDAVPGPCTDDTGPESWPPSTDWKASMGDQATLMLDGKDTNAPFCLWAFAIDSHGAMNADHMAVVPQDQAPIARLTVVDPDPVMFIAGQGTYPLHNTIFAVVVGSSD